METRELYWLTYCAAEPTERALEPEDTCRQAALTTHMHPRSPEPLLMALVLAFLVPCLEQKCGSFQGAGVRPEHLSEQVGVWTNRLMPPARGL